MVTTMSAMHEDVHQRACQQHKIRQYAQHVSPVINHQESRADTEYAPYRPVNTFPHRDLFVCGLGCVHQKSPLQDQVSRVPRSRSALVTTDTELSAIAAPAKIGDSSKPKTG